MARYIIETTDKQDRILNLKNIYNLPITSFLKSTFGFKSVEIVEAEKLDLQEIIYNMNEAQ